MKVVKKVIIGLVGLVSGILSIFLFFFNSYSYWSVFDSLKTLFAKKGVFEFYTGHLQGDTLWAVIIFFISFPIMIICIRSLFKK